MRAALALVLLLGCGSKAPDPVIAHEDPTPSAPDAGAPADTDRDSIVDANDRCPADPENFNGHEDDDGCPDRTDTGMIIANVDPIIIERVYFDAGKSAVPEHARELLDAVVATLDGNPSVLELEVQGHTDDVEAKTLDLRMALSDQRAQAVVAYLVANGVASDRLVAAAYADTKPLDAGKTADARAKNRRVEFLVLETSD